MVHTSHQTHYLQPGHTTTLTSNEEQPVYVFIEVIKLCVLGNGEVVGVDVGELCTHASDAVLQQLCQQRHTVFGSLGNTSLVSIPHRTRTLHCLPCLITYALIHRTTHCN